VIGAIFFFFSRSVKRPGLGAGAPPVVIVTVLDSTTFSEWYIDDIKENRIAYAKRHGEITSKSTISLGSPFQYDKLIDFPRIWNFLSRGQ
jgi:hypothetical protein